MLGLRTLFCVSLSWLALATTTLASPNVIVILSDDHGYADIGPQGCKDIPTPHIDSIAANGVRFTDGHANHPVCAPTRAALMSGRYQHRFGFEFNPGPREDAVEEFGFPKTEQTLAERMKGLGYRTGMIGKWHLGYKEGLWPHERGFDSTYIFLGGARQYFPSNREPILRDGVTVPDTEYTTDAFGEEAVKFITSSGDKPFFLYLPFNAVHGPLEATDKYLSRFDSITDPKRKTYAGMLSAMDDAVGRVLQTLRERKLEENTLVVFFGDNGGPTGVTTSRNDPLRGVKGQVLEGGHRVPFLMQWKGTLKPGTLYHETVAGFDVHATAIAVAGGEPLPDRPMDGVNLLPYLKGEQAGAPHKNLVWKSGDNWAVRQGDWKLLRMSGTAAAELYNLKNDIGEAQDLASAETAKVQELQAVYDSWKSEMPPPKWGPRSNADGKGTRRKNRTKKK